MWISTSTAAAPPAPAVGIFQHKGFLPSYYLNPLPFLGLRPGFEVRQVIHCYDTEVTNRYNQFIIT